MTRLTVNPESVFDLTEDESTLDLIAEWAEDHDHGILLPDGRLIIMRPHALDDWICVNRLRVEATSTVVPDGWRAEADGTLVPCAWAPRDATPDPWCLDTNPRYLDRGVRWDLSRGTAERVLDSLYLATYGLGREDLRAWIQGPEGALARGAWDQYEKAQRAMAKAQSDLHLAQMTMEALRQGG